MPLASSDNYPSHFLSLQARRESVDVDPKYKVPPREEIAANLRGLWMVARSSPWFLVAALSITVLIGATPAIIVAATGSLLGSIPEAISKGAQSAAAGVVRASLILLAAGVFLSQVLDPVQQAIQFGLRRRFLAYMSGKLMAAVTALPGMAYFEDPKFRDKLEISEWIGWAPATSVQMLVQTFQQLSTIAGYAVVAGLYKWWVPFVVIGAALPAGYLSVRMEMIVGLARWRHSDEMRRSDYYRDMALKLEPAKELRIFGLKSWVLDRQARHYAASMKEAWDKRRRSMTLRLGLRIPAVIAMAFTYIVMLRDASSGVIGVGRFAASSMAIIGMASMVVALFASLSWVRRSNFYLPVAFQILDLAKVDPRLEVRGRADARALPRTGIEFRGVRFAYPGSERVILDGLDLWIPAGSSLALVGENGAGKTTLIKLLCRMYDPTEGSILLDGRDIREMDLTSLRTRLAVIFQDFVRYNLSAEDNVGFGSVSRLGDRELATEAARRVGVLEKIEELPDGWTTPLAKEFGGVDLSGGEWQRIALARAIAAQVGTESDVLILDEPTASLDVRVEHDLYEQFERIAGESTTLLVSHRFSTVRMAERIVFLEEGGIVEDGSHDELMALGGSYSELYDLQASHYRLTGTIE